MIVLRETGRLVVSVVPCELDRVDLLDDAERGLSVSGSEAVYTVDLLWSSVVLVPPQDHQVGCGMIVLCLGVVWFS